MKNRKVVGSFISLALVFVYAILMITSHRFTVFSLLWIIAIPVAIVSTVRLVRYFKNKKKTKTKPEQEEEVEEINEEQKTLDEEEERRPKMKFNWRNFLSMAFAVLFAVIAIVMIIVKFAWLSLIPVAMMSIALICYFAFKRNDAITADEEEDKEAGKAWFWHMVAAIVVLVLSVLLIAIYAMVGGLLKDATTFKNLVVDTLVVNQDATVEGDVNVQGNVNVEQDVNVKEDLNVSGDVNVEQNVNVKEDLNVSGNVNVEQDVNVKGDLNVDGDVNVEQDVNVKGDLNVGGNVNTTTPTTKPTTSTTTNPTTSGTTTTPSTPTTPTTPTTPSEPTTPSTPTTPSEPTTPTEPAVEPKISAPKTIAYGETVYVNLTGIKASDLLVSNKRFVSVEKISDSRVAITLTEDVDGYITITDSVSRVNVVMDIMN